MNHVQKAEQLFTQGYNCAQAIACAFCDITGLSEALSARLASSFGGGLGRMREVCGAVSGAAMVLGVVYGCSDPEDREAKKAHYALVQDFARRFKEQNGSIICRELLAGVTVTSGSEPEARTDHYYKKRPCRELVGKAAEILDQMLFEKGGA